MLIGALIGGFLGMTCATLYLWRARERTYRYAVRMAESYDLLDPAGRAYSDMATVIVLDGRVD